MVGSVVLLSDFSHNGRHILISETPLTRKQHAIFTLQLQDLNLKMQTLLWLTTSSSALYLSTNIHWSCCWTPRCCLVQCWYPLLSSSSVWMVRLTMKTCFIVVMMFAVRQLKRWFPFSHSWITTFFKSQSNTCVRHHPSFGVLSGKTHSCVYYNSLVITANFSSLGSSCNLCTVPKLISRSVKIYVR